MPALEGSHMYRAVPAQIDLPAMEHEVLDQAARDPRGSLPGAPVREVGQEGLQAAHGDEARARAQGVSQRWTPRSRTSTMKASMTDPTAPR